LELSLTARAYAAKASRSYVMTDMFERLRHSQFAEPIWQPVIFALLVVAISITLALILQS
jgi:hypothetical protein